MKLQPQQRYRLTDNLWKSTTVQFGDGLTDEIARRIHQTNDNGLMPVGTRHRIRMYLEHTLLDASISEATL